MEFVNITAFSPFYFTNVDQFDREFHILIFRGTFKLKNGVIMKPVPGQDPVQVSDVFYLDDPLNSTLTESDIIPYKPATDIIVTGHSYAPGGQAKSSWGAQVQLGEMKKTIVVYGDRYWYPDSTYGWKLGSAKPAVKVPLCYELAYGGQWRDNDGNIHCYEQNPVGRGFIGPEQQKQQNPIPAPQIESIEQSVKHLNGSYRPEGLGPIGRGWLPRQQLVGTTDESWAKEDFPGLPYDFDFAFYNCAHPDLIYPGFVRGNEVIKLINLDPASYIETALPGLMVGALINQKLVTRGFLDTVILSPDQQKASLIWRATFRSSEPIHHIEARVIDFKEKLA